MLVKYSFSDVFQEIWTKMLWKSMREKCPYSEFLWSVISRIRAEYGEILCISSIQSECGKMQTRKTPNTDTFHAMSFLSKNSFSLHISGLLRALSSIYEKFCFVVSHYYFALIISEMISYKLRVANCELLF